MTTEKTNVLHIITGLELGGAEMMLYKLLDGAQNLKSNTAVVSLTNKGQLGESIQALGVPVYEIGMQQGRINLKGFKKFHNTIRCIQPDLIQAWMYHGNIAASLLGLLHPKTPVIWNIRHTPYNLSHYKRLTRILIRYGKWLARQPVCVVYNSFLSAKKHKELGYQCRRVEIIPNGFDVEEFKPSKTARNILRKSLGLPHSTFVIGMIARYHPMKDHANFLQAAHELYNIYPDVHFVLAGPNVDKENAELMEMVTIYGLSNRMHLLGSRTDVADLTAGLDIATLSSAWGDAFPNVIGEAMSCGVPCVVTDIGDSAKIVGDTGMVVPPRNPRALAASWRHMLEMGEDSRGLLGSAARNRIIDNYTLPVIIQKYESLYFEILRDNESL